MKLASRIEIRWQQVFRFREKKSTDRGRVFGNVMQAPKDYHSKSQGLIKSQKKFQRLQKPRADKIPKNFRDCKFNA